ncbi:sodium/hydrogen exchanger 9B2-like [Antedon mediterranea]|uniref:sodium/hydrogen exchanger 9B2-like n=1 Tax=Antedon mediterranea TaxID=105859 RepID=UPI003AF91D95
MNEHKKVSFSDTQILSDKNGKLKKYKTDENLGGHMASAADTCCTRFSDSCIIAFSPWITRLNPLPEEPSRTDRCKYALMCPPHGTLAKTLTYVFVLGVIWAAVWSITGEDALPGGNLFSLYVLLVCCKIGGILISFIKMPPLLGMLIVGLLLANVPYIDVANDITPAWSEVLRNIALAVILVRAGLGVDAKALQRLKYACLRLAFLPTLFEACSIAIAAVLLLGFPWLWAFMLGFVLAAVSPAVVVPSLLILQERGFGLVKGIPTLIIASASIDNVFAISVFGVLLATVFSSSNMAFTILRGPLEVVLGSGVGLVVGMILWFLPNKNQSAVVGLRSVLIMSSSVLALLGLKSAGFSGAGALACLILPFVAGLGWKKEKIPVGNVVSVFWLFFEPLLFGLIGAEVAVSELQPSTVGLGIAIILIGSVVRMAATYLSASCGNLSRKEKMFTALAWLPKATVQAAIGSTALIETTNRNRPEQEQEMAKQILTLAVLVILITAPIGAIMISLTGPKCLDHSSQDDEDFEDDEDETRNSDIYQDGDDPFYNRSVFSRGENGGGFFVVRDDDLDEIPHKPKLISIEEYDSEEDSTIPERQYMETDI